MSIALTVLAVIAALIGGFLLYRYIKVHYQGIQITELRNKRVKPLFDRLEAGHILTMEDVHPFAADKLTRQLTYLLLNEFKQAHFFPAEYNNHIKAAESDLANWLEFPTELGICPDEMEHIKQVTILFDNKEDQKIHYHVFRFRTHPPHWASKDGWILGVAGPHFDDSPPYGSMTSFSRFSPEGKVTAEEEAKWMHENVAARVVR